MKEKIIAMIEQLRDSYEVWTTEYRECDHILHILHRVHKL